MKQNYICPFCGSKSLTPGSWSLDCAETEVKALECDECYAGAPLDAWRKFADRPVESINAKKTITVEDWVS